MTLIERINQYLQHGGLWNPELMDHDAVRRLLIDVRAELEATASPNPAEQWPYDFVEIGPQTYSDILEKECLKARRGKPLPAAPAVEHTDDCTWNKTRLTLQRHCSCGAAPAVEGQKL